MAERPEPLPPEEQERAALQAALDYNLTAADAGQLYGQTTEEIRKRAANIAAARELDSEAIVDQVRREAYPEKFL